LMPDAESHRWDRWAGRALVPSRFVLEFDVAQSPAA
jgi:hypothetical protein